MTPITTTYVESRDNRSGQQRTYVAGSRVRVLDIYVMVELKGQSPDDVVAAFPALTLAQVHGALAYYFDHREQIVHELLEEQKLGEKHQQLIGPGPLAKKLGQLAAAFIDRSH